MQNLAYRGVAADTQQHRLKCLLETMQDCKIARPDSYQQGPNPQRHPCNNPHLTGTPGLGTPRIPITLIWGGGGWWRLRTCVCVRVGACVCVCVCALYYCVLSCTLLISMNYLFSLDNMYYIVLIGTFLHTSHLHQQVFFGQHVLHCTNLH